MQKWMSRMKKRIPDAAYIRMMYFHHFGRLPNLNHPVTFNEKLQWLKLYDHNPLYTTMVDKVKVKDYIASVIGPEYVIPTIGVWKSAEEISFRSLPPQFVIKCNHDSHGVIICKDKTKTDEAEVKKLLADRLKASGFDYGREWPYKNVKRRIIAEEYIPGESGELMDYKIHNFNGEPGFILVCQDRFSASGLKEDFYDTEWRHLDVRRPGIPNGKLLERPAQLEEMLRLSKILSKGIPFLRTDFYCVRGKVLFGELTLFPASGFQPFVPDSYDLKFGKMITLPDKTVRNKKFNNRVI